MEDLGPEVLQRWAEELRGELAQLNADKAALQAKIDQREQQLLHVRKLLELAEVTDRPAAEAPSSRTVSDAAFELLTQVGQPMHYVEMAQQLGRYGAQLSGVNPGANLLAHIGKDKRFVRTARGMYGLAGRDRAVDTGRVSAPRTSRRRRASRAGKQG